MADPAANLIAVDDEHGLAFGWGLICSVEDKPYFNDQGVHTTEGAMLKAASAFMLSSRPGWVQHARPAGQVVFGFPMTRSIAASLGITSPATGLLVGMKADPTVLAKFKSGEFAGFSIGFRRILETPA